jgi:hypothetical protein
VQAIQLDHPDKPGDDQHALVQFSSRLTVPRSDGKRTFASEPRQWLWRSRFFAIDEGLSLRRHQPVSEFDSDEAMAGARTRGHEGGL